MGEEIYMYREALHYLEHIWFNDSDRKPLILRGARQVGKTWIAREFAKNKALTLVELNFERNPELKSLFDSNDPKIIMRNIASYIGVDIKLESSFLFLDEIQDAPEVLSKLRWFYEELPALSLMAAGSLLEFILSDYSLSMPVGRVSYLYIEPFSFEEFLGALDETMLLDYVKNFDITSPIPLALHQKLNDLFRIYCHVGGMPACIAKWRETQMFSSIIPVQEDLLATYKDDFYKYKGKLDVTRLLTILRSIPHQLGQKFKYSKADPTIQSPAAKQILKLFNQARICHNVQLTAANSLPLNAEVKEKAFKQIFLDVGLANCMLSNSLRLKDSKNIVDGGLSEQIVGQMLRTLFPLYKDPELYYWQREEKGLEAEVDYLIESHGEIIPIEIKSGTAGTLKSLHYFMYLKGKKNSVRIYDGMPNITKVNVYLPNHQSEIRYQLLSIPFYLMQQLPRILNSF